MRGAALLALLLTVTACRSGRNPEDLLGTWQNGRDRLEFAPGGAVSLHSARGVAEGEYAQLSRALIRVDLGSRWPSGAPRYWYAMRRGDQLGLCEIHNGRHCMRFARPGRRVEVLPR